MDALEERMLMNNRFVVPGTADNVTTFGTLHAALTTPGLNAGDVIQIEPNASPGQLHNADGPAVLVRPHPAVPWPRTRAAAGRRSAPRQRRQAAPPQTLAPLGSAAG
jgi:hypothetical protein